MNERELLEEMEIMPKGVPILPDELQHIMDLFTDCRKRGMALMESYQRVGDQVGRDKRTIGIVISRLKPTTRVAQMYARAKAYRLVKRVIRKASVDQAIDLLSRPEMGVFSPNKSQSGEGNTGFFISVNAGDCGAAKADIIDVSPARKELAPGDEFNPFSELQESYGENPKRGSNHAVHQEAETTIARAKRKLREARELHARNGSGDEGNQKDPGV